jgi:LmbE family N-acetylglucosaminyl deacetylase
MVLAPHPDDESLATGTLLLRALAAGADVRVVFVTSGDNNPWAQRATERRLRIRSDDRARFGLLREAEAIGALGQLGVPPACARFLRFPDQGLTDALLHGPSAVLAALVGVINEFRPTLLACPSLADLHPDHSALGVLARVSVARASQASPPRELAYVVHNPCLRGNAHPLLLLHRTPEEATAQRAAVARHRSQMVWRRRWMFSFLDAPEFYMAPAAVQEAAESPLDARREGDAGILVTLRSRARWRCWGRRTLAGVVENEDGTLASFVSTLPGSRRNPVTRLAPPGGSASGVTREGSAFRVSASLAPPAWRAFLKLERRYGFFDEGGWIEVPPAEPFQR